MKSQGQSGVNSISGRIFYCSTIHSPNIFVGGSSSFFRSPLN